MRVSEEVEGRDEWNRLKVRLEKATKRPAWDRGNQSISGAPRSYTVGQQKRAAEMHQQREKTNLDKLDEHTCRQKLENYEKKLGPLHPKTLSLGERICRQTLAGNERKLGPLHQDTLALLQNLAGILQSQGKLVEAEHNMRLLHMRRRMRENETPRRKAQNNDQFGTGANPPILLRKVPAKPAPHRVKPDVTGSSTDRVPASPSAEMPKPPSKPRPQSAPSRRRHAPSSTNSFGMSQTTISRSTRSPDDSIKTGTHVQASGSQDRAETASQAECGESPELKEVESPPSQDPYVELRARLVEQMAENCCDRMHGESQMRTLLHETRERAFQMSEELLLDPKRCAEVVQKLETDLGLNAHKNAEINSED